MMATALRETLNISAVAKATGLQRVVVSVILRTHDIPRIEAGNQTLIKPEGLGRLVEVLLNYPGVDPGFVERL